MGRAHHQLRHLEDVHDRLLWQGSYLRLGIYQRVRRLPTPGRAMRPSSWSPMALPRKQPPTRAQNAMSPTLIRALSRFRGSPIFLVRMVKSRVMKFSGQGKERKNEKKGLTFVLKVVQYIAFYNTVTLIKTKSYHQNKIIIFSKIIVIRIKKICANVLILSIFAQ